VGARILGAEGDEIGQISDVVLDKQSGCMAYVVLSIDQGGTRKLVTAPWTIFSPGSDNHTYTVRVAREKIYSAPAWESSRIEEYSRATWINNVYSYYGVQPQPGVNIQTDVGVNTGNREETKTNISNRQGRERTQDQTQAEKEEPSARERNPDMLIQPSPGQHGRRAAAAQGNESAADHEARREERRERRAQRESDSAAGADSPADQSQSGNAEERAERHQTRTGEQTQPPSTNDDTQRQSAGTNENEGRPAGADENQPQRSRPETREASNPQSQNAARSDQSNRAQQRQRAHQPAAQPSPTP